MFITNTINKQIFDFTCHDEMMARQMQQEVIPNTIHILDDIIDEILTKEFDKEEHLLIDKIEIDLGDIDIENFGNEEMLEHFKGALKQKITPLNIKQNLAENDEVLSFSEADLQMTLAFLLTGSFPWWADKTAQVNIDKMLKKLVSENPEAIKSFLLKQNAGSVADRLAKQFKPSTKSAIDALVPGFTDHFIKKPTFAEGEYEIDLKDVQSKILEKLAFKTQKKRIRWSEEYKTLRLVKLLKQGVNKWIKALQSLNILTEYELEKIRLSYSRKNKIKRKEAIEILKKLSVFQVEFLLQTATVFYPAKKSEYESPAFESEFSPDEFLDKASNNVSQEIFSQENINLKTAEKSSGTPQLLHQGKEKNEIDDLYRLQDKADFETEMSVNKNQSAQVADVTKEVFVNEFQTKKATTGKSVEEGDLHNVAAKTKSSYYENNKSHEKISYDKGDQFSIFKKTQKSGNSNGKTLDTSELIDTNKFSHNNQNKENQSKIISSENEREYTNIYYTKNLEHSLSDNINNLSENDQIQLNHGDTISSKNERENSAINFTKNLEPGLLSNINNSIENKKIQSNQSDPIFAQSERDDTNIDDSKNLGQSLFSNTINSIENKKIQSNQNSIILTENKSQQNKTDDVKDLQQKYTNDRNRYSQNSKIDHNEDNTISDKFSAIRPLSEENSRQTNESNKIFHLDNNTKPYSTDDENKQNENEEVNNSANNFHQVNNNKPERVVADGSSTNYDDKDYLIEERTYDNAPKQSEADEKANKQFEYKNSEIQQNSETRLHPQFSDNNRLDLKTTNETKAGYDYKKKSGINYIRNKLGASNQSLFKELNLLKEEDLLTLVTRFKQFEQAEHQRKKFLNILIEHPYLFRYDLLQILTGLYFMEAASSATTKQFIGESKTTEPFLSALSENISSSREKFFHTVNNLTATEEIVLQDVLKKKLYETESEKKIIKKVFKKLPEESLYILQFLTQFAEEEVQQLSLSLRKDTRKSNQSKPFGSPSIYSDKKVQKLHIENAGLCIIAAYLPLLFSNLRYLEKGIFKNKAIAARALILTQYIATGKPKSPEYLLQFNKLLCGFPIEESIPANIRLTKKERMEANDLLESVIENWETIKNTSRNGFRESFLQRRGLLTENELTWTLQIEDKSYDMLLSTITWGFGIIKLPWMEKHIQVEWQNTR